MAKYINLEELMKFPIRRNHYDKEHGNEHFIYGIETVLEYAESLPAADVVQEWISVDDRLPEAGVAVLARCFYHENWRTLVCFTSKNNVGEWYTYVAWRWVKVTHWMPLPEPPKGE